MKLTEILMSVGEFICLGQLVKIISAFKIKILNHVIFVYIYKRYILSDLTVHTLLIGDFYNLH